jgi:transcription termination factor Rho
MTKAELESKHLSDLHLLASEAGVPKYRMLSRAELIARLAEGGEDADGGADKRDAEKGGAGEEAGEESRPPRRRRRRRPGRPETAEAQKDRGEERSADREPRDRGPRERQRSEKKQADQPQTEPRAEAGQSREGGSEAPRPRRRRRRRFGRRGKQGVTLQSLLLPPEAGRQALVFAESRETCTALLRGVAADLSADSKGPDPVALLIDPSPEELADWRREAPHAEIVAAGQPRHASDALAQAAARAGGGEDVILLVDSLTRLAEAYEDPEAAKEFFDAGRAQGTEGNGSLTIVAALQRSSD